MKRETFGLVCITVMASVMAGCPKKSDDDVPPPPSATVTAVPPPPTATVVQLVPPTGAGDASAPATLAQAIEAARPQMKDSSGAPDDGSATLLRFWLAKTYPWAQMEAVAESQPAAFLAGPDALRGRRVCGTGTIKPYAKVSPAPAQSDGMLTTKTGDVLSFSSVGDTTGIAENGQGRFCGIASGVLSTAGADGKPVRAVRVVGYFDTPANHAATGGGGQFASLRACCQALQQNSASMPPPQNLYAAGAASYCLATVASISNPAQKDAMLAGIRGALKGVPMPAACH
jgi:hypothetical protein